MSAPHVYAVFDEETGKLIAITAGIVGAGAAAIGHAGSGFVDEDGNTIDLDALTAALSREPATRLRPSADAGASVRIERWYLGP